MGWSHWRMFGHDVPWLHWAGSSHVSTRRSWFDTRWFCGTFALAQSEA